MFYFGLIKLFKKINYLQTIYLQKIIDSELAFPNGLLIFKWETLMSIISKNKSHWQSSEIKQNWVLINFKVYKFMNSTGLVNRPL